MSAYAWRDVLQPYGLSWPGAETVAALHNLWPETGAPVSGRGLPLRVVESGVDQGAAAYESAIANTGLLSTRNNSHDWFNALMWLAYPESKRVMNRLQAEQAEKFSAPPTGPARSAGNARTRLRDALTVLDENGAVFVTSCADRARALQGFQWHDLFVTKRTDWHGSSRLFLIGHALLEKLEQPHLGVCAHVAVWLMPATQWEWFGGLCLQEQRAQVDQWLAHWIEHQLLTPQNLQPLPVLGVPGWWADNESEGFYNNSAVFRRGRGSKPRSDQIGLLVSNQEAGQAIAVNLKFAEESPDSTGQSAG